MILKNLIYILQSENYDFWRFLSFCYSHLAWWRLEQRQKIVWTAKAHALRWVSTFLFLGVAFASFYFLGWTEGEVTLVLSIVMLPFYVGVALFFIMPLDRYLKWKKVSRAKEILQKSGIRVIGITGSYGKTTTKEILAAILSKKFSVIKTPDNVNTDVGIADFVISHFREFTKEKIFIVEMGAYQRGEIARICAMVKPEYSILTGINEAHLERFGSLSEIIETKFELPVHTEKLAVLNCDDENVKKNYARFVRIKSVCVTDADVQDIVAKENFSGWQFVWQGTRFEIALLARHNIVLVLLCAPLARELGFSLETIRQAVKNIRSVPHRLEPIYNAITDIMVIDDSYNGNVAGIKSGIELLSLAKGRKVVLTPGIVELGGESGRIHRQIGELYGKSVDLALLIKSRATSFIIEGLQGNASVQYKVYTTTEEAHRDLANVLRKGDTIIFQNDLTDNYF
ncbi:MAG: UDP-N-acetylmuramoyl-tripeptide--D-alanyl-D-alanine ligase [bacterium]|nr:UDP-N-acetylmuramoyl-tripeptide--D-alanyl-D-alanine ligase [bacterium]